jgi:hypothetical protein
MLLVLKVESIMGLKGVSDSSSSDIVLVLVDK